LSKYPS
jgi:hypothetical protein